jgi:hypothetical protein
MAPAYFSLVRPNLEYCASIWNPHHKQSIQKLEMTQRRAARYTTNIYTTTSSVNEMLQQLKWETLESRRTKIQLTMFYKIVNNLVDIPADHYLTPSKTRTRTTHSKKMLQYHTRTVVVYLAALRCVISNFCIDCLWWGFHIDAQYSRFGRTRLKYAAEFVSWLVILRFLFQEFRNSSMLLAFFVVLSM